ncbi:hypothetical protein VTK73DRAFT_2656 [Phialemonium thermophilum]|uniref:Uncharacterized protein n=1 Tax=Phialemonium thermophilum TaxID=223376 RepID=A0ABR3VQD2_9PEZI
MGSRDRPRDERGGCGRGRESFQGGRIAEGRVVVVGIGVGMRGAGRGSVGARSRGLARRRRIEGLVCGFVGGRERRAARLVRAFGRRIEHERVVDAVSMGRERRRRRGEAGLDVLQMVAHRDLGLRVGVLGRRVQAAHLHVAALVADGLRPRLGSGGCRGARGGRHRGVVEGLLDGGDLVFVEAAGDAAERRVQGGRRAWAGGVAAVVVLHGLSLHEKRRREVTSSRRHVSALCRLSNLARPCRCWKAARPTRRSGGPSSTKSRDGESAQIDRKKKGGAAKRSRRTRP